MTGPAMIDTGIFMHLVRALQGGVVLALLLHALAIVPQWRAHYFNPGFLNISGTGLLLGVAHGCVIALAQQARLGMGGDDGLVAWSLAAAVLLNIVVAVQNLLAVLALVHLHRPSAVAAQRLRAFVQPMIWTSAALALAAYFVV